MPTKNVTYSKEREQKLKDTIQKLRAEIKKLKNEVKFLKNELNNIVKPIQKRKPHVEQKSPKKMTREEWREDFMNRHEHLFKRRKKVKDE